MIVGRKQMLITDLIYSQATKEPNKIAITTLSQEITYKEFTHLLNQTAHALMDSPFSKKRDSPLETKTRNYTVAMLLLNRVEFLQCFLGTAMLGGIAVPFDPKWSTSEMENRLEQCTPDVLIIDQDYVGRIKRVPPQTRVIIYNEEWTRSYSNMKPDVPSISDDTDFYMGYTSGTTGKSKAFTRSHRSWVHSFEVSEAEFGIRTDDHIMAPGPLVHSLSLFAAVQALCIGSTLHLLEKFEAGEVLNQLKQKPISIVYLVPTMIEALLLEIDKIGEGGYLSSAQALAFISSGAKLLPSTKQQLENKFSQVDLYEFYGASELSFVTILDPVESKRSPDSVGRPFYEVQVSIRNTSGAEAEVGEVGRLFVQSEMLFSGYANDEEETQKVLQKGWATVGDLAKRDEDGYIYLVGREKNMIISGGLNIYPEEVEKVLKQLSFVEEAVVIGASDSYWGEKLVALIVPKEGAIVNEKEILEYCREVLSSYKCPRQIIKVNSLPYTSSGKVARSKVKADYILEIAEEVD
jgi:long-chain acyl-CoA synthetase